MSSSPAVCERIDEATNCSTTNATVIQSNSSVPESATCDSYYSQDALLLVPQVVGYCTTISSSQEIDVSTEHPVVDVNVDENNQTSNCTMLAIAAVCYLFITFLPDIAQQLNTSQQTSTSSQTSVPTDGASTIYLDAKPAQPFFLPGSLVYDSYTGGLYTAGKAVEENGYVFVMYYAAWSLRCRRARKEFEAAAKIMRGRVPFVAIHCWYQSSQCRSKYKFYSFPSFYFYASGMDIGFAYKGVDKSHYFVRFIESLLNPITHIFNSSQLNSFVSSQESSLVGYFNLSKPEPAGRFQQFYYASLRSIEKDFLQPVRFAVLSNREFASQYSMNEDRNLLLVRSVQENLVYPRNNNFTSTAITAWVHKNRAQPLVKWIFPQGKKSVQLYQTLKSGPTVILLTAYDACSVYNHDASLLREVALDYYSCNSSIETTTKISSFIAGSMKSRQQPPAVSFCIMCQKVADSCCYSIASSSPCQVCKSEAACNDNCALCSISESITISSARSACYSLRRRIAHIHDYEMCCGQRKNEGRRVTDNYVKNNQQCISLATDRRSEPSDHNNVRLVNDGAACKYNVTPNFLAMDNSLYAEFASRFGINSMNLPISHLALIDLADESYYVMEGSFNKSNIVNFLEDFSSGNITRSHQQSSHPKRLSSFGQSFSRTVSVKDISSMQLEDILSNWRAEKDVVVLFYSKWCLHCKAVNHLFLSSIKYLTKFTSIQFFRIDVSENVLSWKYAVNRVPTITLFTQRGEAELLPLARNVEDFLGHILRLCSLKHLIEMTINTSPFKVLNLLPHVLSRITTLERKFRATDCVIYMQSGQLGMALKQPVYNNKLALLNLRKLYLYMYSRTIYKADHLSPLALQKLYMRLKSLQKYRLV